MTTRDADRLLPAEPAVRAIARGLYERTAGRPIVSPHGHVPAALLAEDRPFSDPAELFITQDHYLTRLLHSFGVDLGRLGLGRGLGTGAGTGTGTGTSPTPSTGSTGSTGRTGNTEPDPRDVWRLTASYWPRFAGTATGYWLAEELDGVFGITDELSSDTADDIFDAVTAALGTPEFRPRALFRRFGIEVLATTDDPLDDLGHHTTLQRDGFRVLPTFRPDRYLDPEASGFGASVQALLGAHGEPATFAGYLSALEAARRRFVEHGAASADHGVLEPLAIDLEPGEAESLFQQALRGEAGPHDARRFRAHMLLQMARMSVADGLVMTVHAGVFRNHSTPTFAAYGPDTGHDIPVATTFVEGLRPLLERYGLEPGFHLALFTVDETTYSREIAPLAGFYPSVFIGAPWWFLDAPDAMARFRSAVTETAGFYRGSGFIDDTRAFLSIPARHDTARRADAGFLARLVAEGRIGLTRAEAIADDLVGEIPRRAFKL